ncbi:MAG: hypothetical protein KF730_02130 [Sphingomonas sp.]|uniref:hypothetical protein n=1 Tax=Sphingomonas sp. TaxID=28214 RepID=UPI0025FBDF92|nr:hypothetical protein [Sphingomonas sp.]MBX3563352.1 hypothetical protein [Sphingomonas sp.]
MSDDSGEWFAPKRYGYGSGLPIAWQGWVIFLGFLAAIMGGATFLAPRYPIGFLVIALILTAAFMLVVARHTRGGWRWRWGKDEDSK